MDGGIYVSNAKRIKRTHLFSQDDYEDDVVENLADANSRDDINDSTDHGLPEVPISYGFEYDIIDQSAEMKDLSTSTLAPMLDGGNRDDENLYEFNLFQPSKKQLQPITDIETAEALTRRQGLISIRSPTPPAASEGRFVRPRRPDSYYFTSALPEEEYNTLKSQYSSMALSGSAIIRGAATVKWPGAIYQWKVIRLDPKNVTIKNPDVMILQSKSMMNSSQKEKAHPRRRPKPSKKRRIVLRGRIAARKALKVRSVVDEEAEREKRTRRNREKKVKRKEREKKKKLAGAMEETVIAENEIDHGVEDT